jgi:hypothetical protein
MIIWDSSDVEIFKKSSRVVIEADEIVSSVRTLEEKINLSFAKSLEINQYLELAT